MIDFGRIHAKEFPPLYLLRHKVEKLAEFLREEFVPSCTFDAIRFIVEEVYIIASYKLAPGTNVHLNLLLALQYDDAGSLPPPYKELYLQLESIFTSTPEEIKDARGFLLEKLASAAFGLSGYGVATNNLKFFEKGGKKELIKGGYYVDSNLKPSAHDEVDVLVDGRSLGKNHWLGECKTSVGAIQREVEHIYVYYELIARMIDSEGHNDAKIVFIFPDDGPTLFPQVVSRAKNSRAVYSHMLRKWRDRPFEYPLKP